MTEIRREFDERGAVAVKLRDGSRAVIAAFDDEDSQYPIRGCQEDGDAMSWGANGAYYIYHAQQDEYDIVALWTPQKVFSGDVYVFENEQGARGISKIRNCKEWTKFDFECIGKIPLVDAVIEPLD